MSDIVLGILFLAFAGVAVAEDNNGDSLDGQMWFIFSDRDFSLLSDDWISEPTLGPTGLSADGQGFRAAGIDTQVVADALSDFITQLSPILNSASAVGGAYDIDQIELSVSLIGEGKVAVFASIGAEAGIKLILRRNQ